MLIRVFPILELSQVTMTTIAWVGGLMTLLPALIACQQNDIKRILAYSTLSEIAYMVMAVGLGVTGPAMYHLVTHAFLSAFYFWRPDPSFTDATKSRIFGRWGSRKRMPFTAFVLLLGTIALCGIPPVSGFWSKDAIFAAMAHSPGLAAISMGAGFFTSFFMLRMILVAFCGEPKSEAARHAHEGSFFMIGPMAVLALLSVVGGLLPVEKFLGYSHATEHASWTLWLSLVLAVAGFVPAYTFYRHATQEPLNFMVLRNKFYVDEFYQRVFVSTQDSFGRLADAFEGGWYGAFGEGIGCDGKGVGAGVASCAVRAGPSLCGCFHNRRAGPARLVMEARGLAMTLTWALPLLLLLPTLGVVAIALGSDPRRTALGVSLLNFIPAFLVSGVVLRQGEILFGPEVSTLREVFPIQFRLGCDGLSLPLLWLTLVVTLAAMGWLAHR